MRFRITQTTRFEYDAPAYDSHTLAEHVRGRSEHRGRRSLRRAAMIKNLRAAFGLSRCARLA